MRKPGLFLSFTVSAVAALALSAAASAAPAIAPKIELKRRSALFARTRQRRA